MKQKFYILLFSFFTISYTGFGQCLKSGVGSDYGTGITRTSGNRQTDDAISNLVGQINATFGTSSQFFFYDDSEGSNAYASSQDMNIYLGVNFLRETLNSETGMTGVAFTLGHELAHIYQFKTKRSNKFMSEETTKNRELQADFLSAYVMGKLGLISPINYRQMLSKTMELGDVLFKEQDHHGSPSERKNSAVSGFSFRQLTFSEAYSKSYTYCCPKAEDKNRIAYTLNIYNGLTYYVILGGALCIKDRDGELQKIAQMASTNHYPFTYTFEFSKNDPSKNLYMDINYQLLDYTGRVVGTITRHDTQPTSTSSRPFSNSTSSEEVLAKKPLTGSAIYNPRFNFRYKESKTITETDPSYFDCKNGYQPCYYCADGYEYCSYCKATGQCAFDHYSAKGSGLCPRCGGTGEKKALNSENNFVVVGTCNKCNGTGKCPNCEGSGKCEKCGGKGRKVCTKCNGTNKLACK